MTAGDHQEGSSQYSQEADSTRQHRRPSPDDRRYVQISLTEHVASQAPALSDDGPIGRLEAVLRKAAPDERKSIKDGLALLVRFADQAR